MGYPSLEVARRSGDVKDLEEAVAAFCHPSLVSASASQAIGMTRTTNSAAWRNSQTTTSVGGGGSSRVVMPPAPPTPSMVATKKMLEDHFHRCEPFLRPLRIALRKPYELDELAKCCTNAMESPYERWMRRDIAEARLHLRRASVIARHLRAALETGMHHHQQDEEEEDARGHHQDSSQAQELDMSPSRRARVLAELVLGGEGASALELANERESSRSPSLGRSSVMEGEIPFSATAYYPQSVLIKAEHLAGRSSQQQVPLATSHTGDVAPSRTYTVPETGNREGSLSQRQPPAQQHRHQLLDTPETRNSHGSYDEDENIAHAADNRGQYSPFPSTSTPIASRQVQISPVFGNKEPYALSTREGGERIHSPRVVRECLQLSVDLVEGLEAVSHNESEDRVRLSIAERQQRVQLLRLAIEEHALVETKQFIAGFEQPGGQTGSSSIRQFLYGSSNGALPPPVPSAHSSRSTSSSSAIHAMAGIHAIAEPSQPSRRRTTDDHQGEPPAIVHQTPSSAVATKTKQQHPLAAAAAAAAVPIVEVEDLLPQFVSRLEKEEAMRRASVAGEETTAKMSLERQLAHVVRVLRNITRLQWALVDDERHGRSSTVLRESDEWVRLTTPFYQRLAEYRQSLRLMLALEEAETHIRSRSEEASLNQLRQLYCMAPQVQPAAAAVCSSSTQPLSAGQSPATSTTGSGLSPPTTGSSGTSPTPLQRLAGATEEREESPLTSQGVERGYAAPVVPPRVPQADGTAETKKVTTVKQRLEWDE